MFIEHYLQCWNATEAARLAQYAHPNKQGPRLLVNVGIKAAIEARINEFKMSADEVLVRLTRMARSNIADFAHIENGQDLAELGSAGQVIKKFKRKIIGPIGGEHDEIELELYDAQAALVHLGKHHGLFTERIEMPDLKPLPEAIRELAAKVYGQQEEAAD